MDTHPTQAIDPAKLAKQFRKQAFMPRQISAVAAGILGNNDQFFHTAVSQKPGFIQHIIQAAAAEFTSQGRNHAISAPIVTAFRNLYERIVFRRGQNSACFHFRSIDVSKRCHPVVLQQSFNGRNDLCITAGTKDSIHLWQFFQNLVLVALGKTAGNQNLPHHSLLFQRTSLEDKVNRF